MPEIPTWLGDEREQRERESRFMECELYALMLAGARARYSMLAVAWAAVLAAATETSLSLFMQALSNRFPAY